MGEKEQGGMLRTVVVVGIVAIIALVITAGIVGLKANLRTNTLMAVDAGHNLVQLKNNSLKASATVLNDDHLNSITVTDTGDNAASLVLRPTTRVQGIFFGYDVVTRNYINAKDRYIFSFDMKSSDPTGLSIMKLGFESSWTISKSTPALSTEWQHYEVNGTRVDTTGTLVIYFNNSRSTPTTLDIRNVELYRSV